jgi:hypothetical protein
VPFALAAGVRGVAPSNSPRETGGADPDGAGRPTQSGALAPTPALPRFTGEGAASLAKRGGLRGGESVGRVTARSWGPLGIIAFGLLTTRHPTPCPGGLRSRASVGGRRPPPQSSPVSREREQSLPCEAGTTALPPAKRGGLRGGVDGDSHASKIEYDDFRTTHLEECGYTVIRFTNRQVLGQIDAVLDEIVRVLDNLMA